MILTAGLLYVAETALVGVWRWAAVLCALGLLARGLGDYAPARFQQVIAAALLGACAVLVWSPVLAILALLLLIPRTRSASVVALTLFAIGMHLVWWRYASGFQPPRIPSLVAQSLSFVLGAGAYVTSTSLIVRGTTIRFATVPWVVVFVPLIAGLALSRNPVQCAKATVFAIGAAVSISVIFALAGHTHYWSQPWWPLVALCIGTVATFLLVPTRPALPQMNWGLWTLATVAATVAWIAGFAPPDRSLRVAFDESHGKWETTDAPFGTQVYGRDTVYNYALLARWLGTKHQVTRLNTHWTGLSGDVLVVKMPTEYYTPDEKRAIEVFVRDGGLLLAIGDHTNLYGTAFILNDLLNPYGLEIEMDATVPWDAEHYDFRPTWWQQSRYLRGVSTLQFQTAATIRVHNPLALPIIVADRVAGEDADYSNERFFGDLHPGPEDRQPPLVLAAERRYGRGRVLLFSDSTIFSNFSLMSPGNRELFQNFLEQGTTGRSWLRVAFVLSIVLGALFVVTDNRFLFGLALLPALSALCLNVPFGRPLTQYPAEWIEIDGEHSRIELRADTRNAHGPAFDDYSTFFAWIGRTGALPRVAARAFEDPKVPTVLVNPDQPFTRVDLERIDQYVRSGGRILVLDDPRFSSRSTSSALLEQFGITLRPTPGIGGAYDPGSPAMPIDLLALPFSLVRDRFSPGTPRAEGTDISLVPDGIGVSLVDGNGTVIGGQKAVGKGIVAVYLRSVALSEVVIGDVWVGQEVDPKRRRLYQLGFDLIDLIRTKEQQ